MSDLPGLILLSLRILMVICLYAFLGGALWILWKDLNQAKSPKLQVITPISISIIMGGAPPATHLLVNPVYIVGRSANCDISLSDETVSGHHAKIYYESANWWIEDLDSSNGTLLNESYLDQPAVLTDNDLLQIGNVKIGVVTLPAENEKAAEKGTNP